MTGGHQLVPLVFSAFAFVPCPTHASSALLFGRSAEQSDIPLASCLNSEYGFKRCCNRSDAEGVNSVSAEAVAFRINPSSVPGTQLLDGHGRLPLAGLGLCCRPSAHGDAVRQGVLDYLIMGGRLLDSASLFENHYEVGIAVRQAIALGVPRSEIFIVTKIWPTEFGMESTVAWSHRVLRELGFDYIDLVLLHAAGVPGGLVCGSARACRQETWRALSDVRAKGLIRSLGVSNFGPRQIGEIIALGAAPITVNQLEYHPWVPQVHRDTVMWCHQHNIAVMAYGSLGGSGLAQHVFLRDPLRQLGRRHKKSVAQVLLRWAVQRNVSVIPGTSCPRHMAENLRIFDFELSRGEMHVLDSLPEDQRMLLYGHLPDDRP
eukprot:TRINITY_DN43433_c0_g1_i1.p1 TRINITY_DN43433_c0_g1~~TRINITY_DN43433_c0_g1_i1.p1  ORF type:complete len:375 (+),score=40.14 TRINITY_DN43433_c0_g1_i1:76-1200(+)